MSADLRRARLHTTRPADRAVIIAALAVPSALMVTISWQQQDEAGGAWRFAPAAAGLLIAWGLLLISRSRFSSGAVLVGLAALIWPTGMGLVVNAVVLLIAVALLLSASVIAIRDRAIP